MPAETVNLDVLRNELEAARVERDLLQATLRLDRDDVAPFRSRAMALAESVPTLLRLTTREQKAFRFKLERLAGTLHDLSQLLRELPGTVRIGPLDDALSRLALLQTLPHATGDELLPIIPLIDTALSSLRRVCHSLPTGDATPVLAPAVPTTPSTVTASMSGSRTLPTAIKLERALQQLIARLSRQYRKDLQLETLGLESVPADWYATLYEVCAELLANAVEHGIESTAGRIAAGKDPIGRLQLHFTTRPGVLELSLRDDGCGLDVKGIFRSAIAAGFWSASETTRDPREAARLIFKPGVTTAADAEGRGHGLRRVLSQLKGLGARIRVSSERGHHLRLVADLPRVEHEEEAPRKARA